MDAVLQPLVPMMVGTAVAGGVMELIALFVRNRLVRAVLLLGVLAYSLNWLVHYTTTAFAQ